MSNRAPLVWIALLLAACSQSLDPCPSGSTPRTDEGMCIKACPPGTRFQAQAGTCVGIGDTAPVATPEPVVDGGVDDGSVPVVEDGGDGTVCEADDVARWQEFHLAEGVVAHMLECATSDPVDRCLNTAAGLESCDACVTDELACVAEQCSSACGASGSDETCRACACEKGCAELFATCAGSELAVCECNDPTCSGLLRPELIMAILHPLLNALPVMMVTP